MTNDVARCLFDRLLGQHVLADTPKRWPLHWNAVRPDLARRRLAHAATPIARCLAPGQHRRSAREGKCCAGTHYSAEFDRVLSRFEQDDAYVG